MNVSSCKYGTAELVCPPSHVHLMLQLHGVCLDLQPPIFSTTDDLIFLVIKKALVKLVLKSPHRLKPPECQVKSPKSRSQAMWFEEQTAFPPPTDVTRRGFTPEIRVCSKPCSPGYPHDVTTMGASVEFRVRTPRPT